jgi:hypothetical protein
MQFIETEDGVLYPISRIEAIRTKPADTKYGDRTDVMIRVDGKWNHALASERQFALITSTVIVPAERHSGSGSFGQS